MAEKLVEMVFSLAGSLTKGTRFLYDVEKDAKEIDGWIKAGYARYIEDEDAVEALVSPQPVAPASTVGDAAVVVAADPDLITTVESPVSEPVANTKRTKAA